MADVIRKSNGAIGSYEGQGGVGDNGSAVMIDRARWKEYLQHLFRECDKNQAEHVRVSKLVDYISGLKLKTVNEKKLSKLRNMLDPAKDDQHINEKDFVHYATIWLVDQVQGTEDEADSRAKNIDSSLGILSQSEMMHSFGIIEDIGSSLSAALADDETSELAQLKRAYEKLLAEKSSLQKRYVNLEDLYAQTAEESKDIQNRLRLIQSSVDSCHQIHAEFEDLKSAKSQTEEKCSILKEDLSSVEAKLKQLGDQNEVLQAKLSSSEQALALARQNEADAICLGDQRAKEVERMTAQVEERAAENEKLHEELDQAVRELQAVKVENQQLSNDVENLLSDISSKEMQLKDARINNSNKILKGLDDTSFDVSGLGEPWSHFDGNVSEMGTGAPSAISTPFSKRNRNSIGDEIKKLGVCGSPLCDKSLLSTSVRRRLASKVLMTDEAAQTEHLALTWKQVAAACLTVAFLALVLFTFFGAIEIDGRRSHPITWVPGWGMPEPIVLFTADYRPQVW